MLVVAGIAAGIGFGRIKQVRPPERTIRTSKESIAAIKAAATGKPVSKTITGRPAPAASGTEPALSDRPATRAAATDVSAVLVEGPWRHRLVAAHGARFHVAELGEGPLVLLLHDFPQFWWAWRAQLVALASAGYRPSRWTCAATAPPTSPRAGTTPRPPRPTWLPSCGPSGNATPSSWASASAAGPPGPCPPCTPTRSAASSPSAPATPS